MIRPVVKYNARTRNPRCQHTATSFCCASCASRSIACSLQNGCPLNSTELLVKFPLVSFPTIRPGRITLGNLPCAPGIFEGGAHAPQVLRLSLWPCAHVFFPGLSPNWLNITWSAPPVFDFPPLGGWVVGGCSGSGRLCLRGAFMVSV